MTRAVSGQAGGQPPGMPRSVCFFLLLLGSVALASFPFLKKKVIRNKHAGC